ncbi:helix-turn-helix domain-containing protein [Kribbella sp. NPDC056951]|uniref:helix-turn-helix domain-containing protein n=1 Tax=Kribbella sp. NPDC056951 TaxID=3345978 RepID=UPI003639D460
MQYYTHEEVRARFIKTPEDEAAVAAYREEALAEIWGYQLAELRRRRGLTQEALAEQLHITQTAVSKIERGELARSEFGTIRKYVEALGGQLEVIAEFGDERLVLS